MKRNLTKSKEYFDIAKRLIPCQTQCLSKGPTQWINNVAPHYLKGGKGCRVWDVDGNEYIDYAMGLGPVVLGYGNESVDNAIKKQLEDGISFTLCHYLEVELAEKLVDILPCAEMVRYGKNGSDVTSAAIKVARSYTGRDKIIACGYHGWQDWYVASTERDRGIPKVMKDLVFTFRYNDIEGLASILDKNKGEISAVIMEPVTAIKPEKGFLEEVKKLTHEAGAILIYDEMFTGFRWSLGGAQEYFNVIP
ncbi:MAG: aminotransferase class III-fold pyridoxal phosphate-dependent enzyme, partial [Nanoarchaeota archaeon]|nr:aminotransferase class III-fold pyridoxal phosphate-dependent enzyme [Nanoarchaeota archaeon]